jgi:hypothetical protein
MEYRFRCNERFLAYKNSSATSQSINFAVRDNCGGNSSVTILDAQHNPVPGGQTSFRPPGGAVTLSIGPNQEVEVFCDGPLDDPQGCRVEIVFG